MLETIRISYDILSIFVNHLVSCSCKTIELELLDNSSILLSLICAFGLYKIFICNFKQRLSKLICTQNDLLVEKCSLLSQAKIIYVYSHTRIYVHISIIFAFREYLRITPSIK